MQKKCWIEKFLELSPKERKRRSLGKKGMAKIKYAPRKVFSMEETKLYLKRNNIFNLTELRKMEHMEDCPSYYFVRKYWGSFEGYRKAIAFPALEKPKLTDLEVIKLLAEYPKVRTLKKYLEQHKLAPLLFVSRREIKKRYGGWKNCRRMADGLNGKSIIERYILLKNQMGRTPSKKEAIDNGIELMYIPATYRELKKFAWMLENPREYVKRETAKLNRQVLA